MLDHLCLIIYVSQSRSAGEGDFQADIVVGQRVVATVTNSSEGANVSPKRDVDLFPVGAYVPASSPVQLVVTDASDTNVVCYYFVFRRWNRRRRRFRRRFTRFRRRF